MMMRFRLVSVALGCDVDVAVDATGCRVAVLCSHFVNMCSTWSHNRPTITIHQHKHQHNQSLLDQTKLDVCGRVKSFPCGSKAMARFCCCIWPLERRMLNMQTHFCNRTSWMCGISCLSKWYRIGRWNAFWEVSMHFQFYISIVVVAVDDGWWIGGHCAAS